MDYAPYWIGIVAWLGFWLGLWALVHALTHEHSTITDHGVVSLEKRVKKLEDVLYRNDML